MYEYALTALGALALAIWIYLLAARGGFWRLLEEPIPPAPSASAPRVIVVIPARNEEASIAQAVQSLAAQAPVIVVDDASSDRTAELAREAGAEVVAARPLPAGWSGKLWAVSEGLNAAASRAPDYWLLTDADIVHAPENIAGLVDRARAGNYDLVSYMVLLACRSAAEQALIPAFVFFFFLLYPPVWIRDPRRTTAGAAGGCMLVRREALDRIGGIARIRSELIDDCALAREIKRSGGRVWLGLTTQTRSIRSYGTFAEIGHMISRTAFTQLQHSWWLLAGTIVGLALTYLAPPIMTIFAPAGAARGLGGLAWLIMTLVYLPAVRFYRRPWFWAPLLPAIASFYMGATVHSAIASLLGRGGMWKGRAQAVR